MSVFVFAFLLGACVVGTLLVLRGRSTAAGKASRERRRAPSDDATTTETKGLRRWLELCDVRSAHATRDTLLVAVMAAVAGIASVLALRSHLAEGSLLSGLDSIPGGVGTMALPLVRSVPWVLGLLLALLPWLVLRASRRRIVRATEEDLPITLELLASLATAGLGFDTALARVLEAGDPDRPLHRALRAYEADRLSGRRRVDALRRTARRLDVPGVNAWVSALVHAEQTGAALASTLQRQAADARARRREQALTTAQSLGVRLVVPLAVCFLPGIFVWTLGPAFYEFIRLVDGVTRNGGS